MNNKGVITRGMAILAALILIIIIGIICLIIGLIGVFGFLNQRFPEFQFCGLGLMV